MSRPPLEGSELSRALVEYASSLGFVRAGIAAVSEFSEQRERLADFLSKEYHGEMAYLAEPSNEGQLLRGVVQAVHPRARSIISVALPYRPVPPLRLRKKDTPAKEWARPYVARYALGQDYHNVVRQKLARLSDVLADLSGRDVEARACVDTAPLLERDVAVLAGFAFIGKNTLAIAPGAGSSFVLGELLVDQQLEPTAGTTRAGCGKCTSCLDVCPTQAFVQEGVLDARRCIAYLTIEYRGSIPRALRSKIGLHVFGCDLCQAVCPFNHGSHLAPPDPLLDDDRWLDLDAAKLLCISSGDYKRLVRGTALRRITRTQFCRNLAVAIGNSAQSHAVPNLVEALESHSSSLVREHVAWALAELADRHSIHHARKAIGEIVGSPGRAAESLAVELEARGADLSSAS